MCVYGRQQICFFDKTIECWCGLILFVCSTEVFETVHGDTHVLSFTGLYQFHWVTTTLKECFKNSDTNSTFWIQQSYWVLLLLLFVLLLLLFFLFFVWLRRISLAAVLRMKTDQGRGVQWVCRGVHIKTFTSNFNHFIFRIIFKNCCLLCKKGSLTVLQFTVYLYFLRFAENGRGCCGAAWLFLCQRAHHLRSLRAVWARSSFLLDFCPVCVCVCVWRGGGDLYVCVFLCVCLYVIVCACMHVCVYVCVRGCVS